MEMYPRTTYRKLVNYPISQKSHEKSHENSHENSQENSHEYSHENSHILENGLVPPCPILLALMPPPPPPPPIADGSKNVHVK